MSYNPNLSDNPNPDIDPILAWRIKNNKEVVEHLTEELETHIKNKKYGYASTTKISLREAIERGKLLQKLL